MLRTSASWLVLCTGFAILASAEAATPAPTRAAAEVALSEGLLAFQEGEDAVAIERLAEAARLDPADGSARYWRGLALLRLGRAREAAAELEASLAARRRPEVNRPRVLADLAAARKAAEGEPMAVEAPEWRPFPRAIDDRGLWEGALGLSAGADSNPNLAAPDLVFPPPGGGGGGLIRGDEGDGVGLVGLRLGVYPFHDREGPVLGVALDAGQSFHRDFGFLDLGLLRGTVQAAFGSDPRGTLDGLLGPARATLGGGRFSGLLQAGGAAWQLDGASYLRTVDGAASFTVREARATGTRLDLGYSDRDFSSGELGDPRQSGQDVSLQVSQLFWFGARSLRLGALFVDRRSSPVYAAAAQEGNATLVWPLAAHWTVLLEGAVRKDGYDDRRSNLFSPGGPARDDTTVRTAATVLWAATDRLRWVAAASYGRRTSNIDPGGALPGLGYRRAAASLGLSWVF